MADILFSNIMPSILEIISKAKKEVKICVGWLSFDYFTDVFLTLLNREVKLQIIVDDNDKNRKFENQIEEIKGHGAKIYFIRLKGYFNRMHEKFLIVDNKICCLGSSNFTKNAMKNIENLMIMKEKHIIFALNYEFESLKNSIAILSTLSTKRHECHILFPELGTRGSNDDERNVFLFYHYRIDIKKENIEKLEFIGEVASEVFDEPDFDYIYRNKEFRKQIAIDKYSKKYIEKLNYDVNHVLNLVNTNNSYGVDAIAINATRFSRHGKETEEYIKVIWRNRFSHTLDQVLDRYDPSDFEYL